MKKQIIVLGDIEMGGGNLTDDFISDKALVKLFGEFSRSEHPIDLVLNGDTFDFLKCPSQIFPKTHYPRHITKEISISKLNLIYQAHQRVFESLKKFASLPDKNIYFILGNHAHDLVYPEIQAEIKRLLSNSPQVHFPGLKYLQHGVHIEHGHQYDVFFKINMEKLFLKNQGKSILNFPFVTFGLISAAMHLKEEHPFLERIFPRPELMTHHRIISRKLNYHTLTYFFKSLTYYPFRFYSDPTYTFPTNLFRELYKAVSALEWQVNDVEINFRPISQKGKAKIYVLGHLHEKRLTKGRKKVIILPGSWRDEYDFNSKTRELIPRTKRHVVIDVAEDDDVSYQLVDHYPKRSVLDFDAVLKNEHEYRMKAAQEEGYSTVSSTESSPKSSPKSPIILL